MGLSGAPIPGAIPEGGGGLEKGFDPPAALPPPLPPPQHPMAALHPLRPPPSSSQAANALARNGSLGACTAQHPVIPVRADEPQVVLARSMNKRVMEALKPLGLASPWAR